MLNTEPTICVGVIEKAHEVRGKFNGVFELPNSVRLSGLFTVRAEERVLVFYDEAGIEAYRGTRPNDARSNDARSNDGVGRGVGISARPRPEGFVEPSRELSRTLSRDARPEGSIEPQAEIRCTPAADATFTLFDVAIGIHFHWERKEDQTFRGGVKFVSDAPSSLAAINEIGVEEYLKSVISSEMSAEAPEELLKAHAITSRSWLVAMLEREAKSVGVPSQRSRVSENEIVRWYDREDHALFDVCADDHCQRYHGISKIISAAANDAVEATRGLFLVHEGKICDARFSKSCGGISEVFESCWEDTPVPYLQPISDWTTPPSAMNNEPRVREWILSSPEAFCNTTDGKILKQVLPSFDQETTDFFRWKVEYRQEELQNLLTKKSGIEFGAVMNLVPLQRGPSGRIVKLRIEGTRRTLTVGKELEIRRWLSSSHLYSSAFVVDIQRDTKGIPATFTLHGAGWGHGVGLCQIGAAVMAAKGYEAEEIVKHYFVSTEVKKLY
ncbi:MAG: SpoIID/LytB domain-containing protein [Ignavibacteriales bacterium]|nr:SpoIID/LytB domain-containing protein [Ignavibacteriales bacterium]